MSDQKAIVERIKSLKKQLADANKSLQANVVRREQTIKLEPSEDSGKLQEALADLKQELLFVQKAQVRKSNDLIRALSSLKFPETNLRGLELETRKASLILSRLEQGIKAINFNGSEVKLSPDDLKSLAQLFPKVETLKAMNIAREDLDELKKVFGSIYIPQPPPASPSFMNSSTNAVRASVVSIDGVNAVPVVGVISSLISERVTNTDGASTALTTFGATASKYNVIESYSIYNSSATPGYLDFRDGTSGAILWTVPLPAGGGANLSNSRGIFKTSANTALAFDVSGALSTVYISVSGFKSTV